jgi:hypothetical protein
MAIAPVMGGTGHRIMPPNAADGQPDIDSPESSFNTNITDHGGTDTV